MTRASRWFALVLLLAAAPAAFSQSRITMQCGVAASGSFSQGPFDFFQLDALPGDAVLIRAVSTATDPAFTVKVALLDPRNQTVLARPTAVTYGLTVLGEYDLVLGGPYQIRVESRDANVSGSYKLLFTFLNRPCVQNNLTCGFGVTGQLSAPLQISTYQFSATAGDLLSLRITKSAPFTAGSGILAAVYSEAGKVLVNASNQPVAGLVSANGSARIDFRAPATGPIQIVLFDRAVAFTDNYSLSITRLNGGCGTTTLTCGAVQQGRITTPLGSQSYSVALSAGDVISIKTAILSAGGAAPLLEIYDPEGVGAPASVFNPGNSPAISFTLTVRSTGTYTVLVRDAATGTPTGDFAITLLRLNRPCTGVSLSCGSLVDGTISGILGTNLYTLQVSAGDVYLLRMLRTDQNASFRPRIEIFDQQAASVQSATISDAGTVSFTAAAGGVYSVIVSDASDAIQQPGAYALSVQRLNRPCTSAAPLSCGTPVAGSFSRPLASSVLTYTAAPGESFSVRMVDSAGALQPALEVYDPQGTAAGTSISGSFTGVDVARPAGGTYTIIATDASRRPSGGPYLVELVRTVEACGTTPQAGQNYSALITGPAPFAIYRLPVTAGDSLLVRSASFTAGFTALMELYDPSGTRLDAQTFRIARTAAASGNYTLIVGASGARTGGAYTFAWQLLNRPAGTQPLECGGTSSASLSSANEFRFYSAGASAGDLMRLIFTHTSDNFAPQIELYDPAGTRFAASGDISQRAAAEGNYLVIVSPSSSTGETGSYAVSYQRPNNPCGAVALKCGQTTLRQVNVPGQLDTFTFSGTGGNRANLRLALRTGDFAPFAELYDAGGTRLTSSSTGSLIATLPASATYSVLVRDRASTGLGSYRVALQDDTNVCKADDTEAPALTLLYPTGGEVIAGAASFQVQWLSDDNVSVASHQVALSTDGGATFAAPIAANLSGNAQSFIWAVPPDIAPTRTAVIRVTAADAAGNVQTAASGPLSIIGSGFAPNSTTTYEYDGLNRVVGVTFASGLKITYNWDAAGNLIGIAAR